MADVELRLIAQNDPLIAGIKESQQAFQGLNNTMASGSKEQEEFIAGVVEGIEKEISALSKSEKAVTKTGESFKAQLRVLKEELSKMEKAGLGGTEQFKRLAAQAAEFEDQIGDTSQRIRILASDTKNLDALMSVGEGLAGGFAIAQSAAAMFGASQEEVEAQLLKVQSALGMLNGIQAVANTLNKDSAARVVLAAKAQKLYALAVGTSTGAMKVFRLALIATGIGALVVGIGMLIANWDKLSKIAKENSVQIKRALLLISPPIWLIIKGVELIQKKFVDLQNLVSAVGAVIGKVLTFDFDNLGKTFDDVIEKEKQLDIEAKQYEATKSKIEARNERSIKLLEAMGGREQQILDYKKEALTVDLEHYRYLIKMGKNVDENAKKFRETTDELMLLNFQQKKLNDEVEKLRLQSLEKIRKEFESLAERARQATLNMLSGRERIDAEEKIQLEEIQKLKKHLESIAKLTKEQYAQIDILTLEVRQKASDARAEIDREERDKLREANAEKLESQQDYANSVRALEIEIAEQKLQMSFDTEMAVLKAQSGTEDQQLKLTKDFEKKKLELKKKGLEFDLERLEIENKVFKQLTGLSNEQTDLQIQSLKNTIQLVQNEINAIDLTAGTGKKRFDIWSLLGIDANSEQGKQAIESFKASAAIIIDQIYQIMDAQLQQAEQNTQLIENRLSDAESALDKELELQKDGYANNVDAKKAEIQQLKEEKKKALKEEEKIKKQQLAIDSAMQASSLITATANIIKGFSSIPIVGQILAIAAIATMWGTFAAARVKASQLITSESKLEKGGHGDSTGIINGKRHSSGGERFSDHIEVEAGERWGVLNRSASVKYGSLFPEMIDSMNKLKFPGMMIKAGTQIVNIDTKKMSSKLDSIDRGISMLNENMANQSDAFFVGKNRVEKKSKHHIRIVHAKN